MSRKGPLFREESSTGLLSKERRCLSRLHTFSSFATPCPSLLKLLFSIYMRTSFRKFFACQKKLKVPAFIFPNFSHFSSLRTLDTSYLVVVLPHYVILPTYKRLRLLMNTSKDNISLPSELPQCLFPSPLQPESFQEHRRSYHYPL